ncbi:WG repeat-containing protein [Aminipila terrae]|uniref:WG repeat-containing protein n=1 Tax=Aminipila terrae TaxID=2697030 RepID=A0A6P1MPN6_9FIRM|nr:WG repeat-containing protein [Aminipila terrae]QHI73626.1 hypothetical protein Ami3637_15705 [Aminipila terrae]
MFVKSSSCLLVFSIIMSGITGNAYANTKGQKSIGDIGVNITWYDFGKNCTHYNIQDDSDTGFYMLNISNNSDAAGKTAFVNGKGEVVLKPDTYDGYSSSSTGGESMTLMKKGSQYLYIDSFGIKTIDGKNYSDIGSFIMGYATVTLKSNGHKGVMDKTGKLIFEDKEGKYKEFEYIGKGLFSASIDGRLFDLLDTAGKPLTNNHYGYAPHISEDTIRVSKNDKYGFLDLSGREIIPLIYDYCTPFYEGLSAVSKDKKWEYVDKAGKQVFSQQFDEAKPFHNGLALVSLNGKWGIVNKVGDLVVPIEYDGIVENDKGYFEAQKGQKSFLINASGEILSTKEYSSFNIETKDRIRVEKTIHNLQVSGYLNKDEKMLTGYKDFDLRYLSDDLYLGGKFGEYPRE